MTGIIAKRKAANFLDESTKRIRIEGNTVVGDSSFVEDEDAGDDYYDENSDGSDEDQYEEANTPITPFSPSRKLFPSQLKTIKCTYEGCTKTFNRPARLAAHLRSHSGERSFVCAYDGCDKAYFRKEHLDQHVLGAHTKQKAYKCDWESCDKSFMTNTRLKRHKATHEGHERFRCTAYPPCNKTFRKHQTLQRHVRTDHLDLVPFPCTYIDTATGVQCNAGYDQAGGLRRHEDRVHGALRFWCDECSSFMNIDGTPKQVGFTTKTELTKHIRNEHANCAFCDFTSSSQKELEKHVEAYHIQTGVQEQKPLGERKSIPCTYPGCKKIFTKNHNLTVHIRTIHEGLRFHCASGQHDLSYRDPAIALWDGLNACGGEFMTKANLEDHIRTQHLGLPTVINANRPRKSDKKQKTADPIDVLTGAAYEARELACLVQGCPQQYIRQYDLEQHLAIKHGISPLGEPLEDDRTMIDRMYDQTDIEWEMRRKAEEGGPFWVGADELGQQGGDEWILDETEMRRLIDQDLARM